MAALRVQSLPACPFPLYDQAETGLNIPMALLPSSPPAHAETAPAAPVTFDDLLVAVGTRRNRDAFIRLFEHFAPRVKSFLMKSGMSADQADELAQETMLTVWHRAESYDPARATASTWIFTIARNKRVDWLRKGHLPEAESDDPVLIDYDSEAPDAATARAQESRTLAAAVAALPTEQAELIRKAYFEEKSHQDIADETDLPLGTVKSRLRLAMDRLRHSLKDLAP